MTGRTGWRLVGLAAVLGLIATVGPIGGPADAGGLTCSSGFLVSETFPSGSVWEMCWEERAIEGIVLHDVTYTPPGGSPIEILDSAYLAQIHVPYDDNGARFHDVSDLGLGGGFMEDLSGADCPGGTVEQNVLCRQVGNGGYAYKYLNSQAQIETLTLFSSSQLGAYNYVVAWNFDEDGTIRPEVGATGRLQRYGGGANTGWNVGGGQFAVAHFHNYYWRLDFDLGGPANDKAQEFVATPGSGRLTWNNSRRGFGRETERKVSPRSQRFWRVRDTQLTNDDGHPISYELLPNTDHVFQGPAFEEFTQNEFYATRFRTCERLASHNHFFPGCAGAPSNLHDFVTGESLASDVVIWYGTSFHHLPRDEDEEHMDAHWTGFSLQPRDLTDVYTIP